MTELQVRGCRWWTCGRGKMVYTVRCTSQSQKKDSYPYINYLLDKTIMFHRVSLHYQSRQRRASAALRSTRCCISSLQSSFGGVAWDPSSCQQAFTCFSASGWSKTTQFSRQSGRAGSHRTNVGLVGTSCGGSKERPRYISSNMSAMSSSSIGSLLFN